MVSHFQQELLPFFPWFKIVCSGNKKLSQNSSGFYFLAGFWGVWVSAYRVLLYCSLTWRSLCSASTLSWHLQLASGVACWVLIWRYYFLFALSMGVLQFAGLTLRCLPLTVYSFTCCFSVLNKLIHSKLKTAIVPARWRHTGPALWKQDPGIQGSCSAVVTQDVRQEPWVEMTYMNWCYLGFVFSFLLKSGEMLCVPASAWHAPQVPGFQKESRSSEWTGLFTQTVGHRESFLAGGGGNHQVLSFLEVS